MGYLMTGQPIKKMVFLDLETGAIDITSPLPPKPVGLAYKYAGQDAHYLSFGHASGNTSTFEAAYAVLKEIYDSDYVMCFHNAKFDLFVIAKHFNLPVPDVSRYDDTMLLAFIVDPEWPSFKLKELCEDLLNVPPSERDDLMEFLKSANPTVLKKDLMGYISTAPADIVEPYAKGDVERTELLYKHLYHCLDERYRVEKYSVCNPSEQLLNAYDREKRVALIFEEMRYSGVRVNVKKLGADIEVVKSIIKAIEEYFFQLVGTYLNLNSANEVFTNFFRLNLIDESKLLKTKTGKSSASSDSLERALKDKQIAAMYIYIKRLSPLLTTYMQKWYDCAIKNDGLIFTDWHSTGARTGRVSSKPNFQNIPNSFLIENLFNIDGENPQLPDFPLKGLKPFSPKIREYVIPYHPDHKIICIDYSQQELRVLSHYEKNSLLEQYTANKNADLHQYVADVMSSKFKKVSKSTAKTINFSIIYGSGVPNLSKTLNLSEKETVALLNEHAKIFPNIYKIKASLIARSRKGLPFYTLGGRRYFAKLDENFEIKTHILINTLIQAGSADMTKQSMIDYYKTKDPQALFILSTHDENALSVPSNLSKFEQFKLVKAMESQKCRAPLVAVAKVGDTLAECK